MSSVSTITLASGCFWCSEAVFMQLRGVLEVRSGFAHDAGAPPAEAVQLEFEPDVITLEQLLQVFFGTHNPTTPDRQGDDIGPEYRSAIFCHDEAQRAAAETMIASLTREAVFPDPIVTQVRPYTGFDPAGPKHHRYFERNAGSAHCQIVIAPKVAKLRARFQELTLQRV
jgi:peptide-methionine (S)-S-oxide reductase